MLLDLPTELIIEILSYLESYFDIMRVRQVDTTLRRLIPLSIRQITTLGVLGMPGIQEMSRLRAIPGKTILHWPQLRRVTVPILLDHRDELETFLTQPNFSQMNFLMSRKLMERENFVDYSFYLFLLRLLRLFLTHRGSRPFQVNLQWHPSGHHILDHDFGYTCSSLVHQDNAFLVELDHLIEWIRGQGIRHLTIQHHLFPPPIQLLKSLTTLTVYLSGNRYGLNETLLSALALPTLRRVHVMFPPHTDVYSKSINMTRLIEDLKMHFQTGLIPHNFELEIFDVPIALNQVMGFHHRFPQATQFTIFLDNPLDFEMIMPEPIKMRVLLVDDIIIADLPKHPRVTYEYI